MGVDSSEGGNLPFFWKKYVELTLIRRFNLPLFLSKIKGSLNLTTVK